MKVLLSKYFSEFRENPHISKSDIINLKLPPQIPNEYLELIETSNGGEGNIGDEYMILYKANDLKRKNLEYEIEQAVPGIFIFGSNGGGEALAFDFRSNELKYILIPFLFEIDAIIVLGSSLHEFLERVSTIGYFD